MNEGMTFGATLADSAQGRGPHAAVAARAFAQRLRESVPEDIFTPDGTTVDAHSARLRRIDADLLDHWADQAQAQVRDMGRESLRSAVASLTPDRRDDVLGYLLVAAPEMLRDALDATRKPWQPRVDGTHPEREVQEHLRRYGQEEK